jgi:hypothetical protein
MHEAPHYSFLLYLCGSKFFNVLINFSLWKVTALPCLIRGFWNNFHITKHFEPVPKLIDCALDAHGANLRFDGTGLSHRLLRFFRLSAREPKVRQNYEFHGGYSGENFASLEEPRTKYSYHAANDGSCVYLVAGEKIY